MSDLIKREDAIEACCKGCGWKESQCDQDSGFWCESGALIRRDIPSADRPQGEWVSDYSSPVAYRCTACNTLQHWSVIQNGRYRFCPNCGARMKGAE